MTRRGSFWSGAALLVSFTAVQACSADDTLDLTRATSVAGPEAIVAEARHGTPKGVRIEQKVLQRDGRIAGRFMNEQGLVTAMGPDAPALPSRLHLGEALLNRLEAARDSDSLVVDVSVAVGEREAEAALEVASAGKTTSDVSEVIVNGQTLNDADLGDYLAGKATQLSQRRQARLQVRVARLAILNERFGLGLSPADVSSHAATDGMLTLTLGAGRVKRLASEASELLEAIDVHQEGSDNSMATARTAISARTVDMVAGATGAGVGLYMTENGCPPNGFLMNYTLLAGSNSDHSRNTSSIMRTVSPDSRIYCRAGGVLPASSDLPGTGGNPAIQIINRSNGNNSPNSSPYDSGNAQWDNWIYDNRILIVTSAGNNGLAGGGIGAPGSGLNILTVGNYDDTTDPYRMASTSSFLDPTSKNAKPELSAPGENIDAGGFTGSGTSMSAPFVSAIGANYVAGQSFLRLKAALLKSTLIAAATDAISSGFAGAGFGGIDYRSGVTDLGWWAFEGNNAVFPLIDSGDVIPNNGTIDVQFWANAGQTIHVVLAWLTRGSYTLGHLNDLHPIGTDLDLVVADPVGNTVGSSASWDNPVEVVTFVAPSSGTYTYKITRFANRDTASNFIAGVTLNRD